MASPVIPGRERRFSALRPKAVSRGKGNIGKNWETDCWVRGSVVMKALTIWMTFGVLQGILVRFSTVRLSALRALKMS